MSFAGFYTRLVFGALQGTLQAHFLRSFWDPNPPLYALWGDFGSFWGVKNEGHFFDRFLGASAKHVRALLGSPERDKGRGKPLPLGIEDDLSGIERIEG